MEIDIQKIAHLARLELTEDEKKKFTGEIQSILGYAEQTMKVNTDGIEPMVHPFDTYNVWQEDIPTTPFTPEQALLNSKYKKENQIVVPKVVE